ncbi:uncharacterized protein LOC116000859 isoform X2 [Ipomoea triloba]|uniref:uncharacterized protein LOC116000859 isoform X2 n=1 Tax=Ipomoea triloba TaxID=35885 RepID=UPI00125D2538|nr:uncharacterized protein LOC116000859 isoform X2 [Ipomoea triloba]XP_031096579.1 uncharacterized protein LOC116000859 isoform X2 [Ipomoea triloba]
MDGFEAIRHLETKLRDVALKVEEEIEFQVADLHQQEEDLRIAWPSHHILQKAIEDDEIQDELVKAIALQGRKTAVDAFPMCGEACMMGGSYRHADLMVGKHNEFTTIKEMQSGNPSKQLTSFLHFGMGGIGGKLWART